MTTVMDVEKTADQEDGAAAAPQATGGSPITTKSQRLSAYIVIAALAGLAMAWFFAFPFPDFLLYQDAPAEAQAVVLFLGPDEAARRRQADDLIAAGGAKFVIVPNEGMIFEAQVSRAFVTPDKTQAMARSIQSEHQQVYIEQSHVEMLQARGMLEHIEATRAVFVSSPYHMRRLKIMAGKVFDPLEYQIAFVPTTYEPPHQPWFLHGEDIRWVFSEWGKIVWFVLYSPFV